MPAWTTALEADVLGLDSVSIQDHPYGERQLVGPLNTFGIGI
jgi:hypothetical protein